MGIAKAAAAAAARKHVTAAQSKSTSKEAQMSEIATPISDDQPETQFLRAASLFDTCSKPAHAGKCFAAAGNWQEAARRFRAAEHWNEAAVALLRSGSPGEAAECFEQAGMWLRALKAWQSAGRPTDLLRAARKALDGSSGTREDTLVFVQKALDALPDNESIREASVLLGAPENASTEMLVDFLADDLGAEAAAMRIMGDKGGAHYDSLAFRAFHRSVRRHGQLHPSWSILEHMPEERRSLMALLYGLEPPNVVTFGPECLGLKGFCVGGGLVCLMSPQGSLPTGSGFRVLQCESGSWEVAPSPEVVRAKKGQETEASLKAMSGKSSLEMLKEAMELPFVPRQRTCGLASRFARDMWSQRGCLGCVEKPPVRVTAALITAAQRSWSGPDATDGSVEQTFAVLCAGGEATCSLFLELRGASKHAALVSFASALRSAAISDAAAALASYIDSPATYGISSNFIFALVSFLVGPATVALQPEAGAHVLSCLVWDWPDQLQHARLKDILCNLAPQLGTLPDEAAAKAGTLWATAAAPAGWDTYSVREAVEAQLAYALGSEIHDAWWDEAWSNAFQPANPLPVSTLSARNDVQRQHRSARAQAGVKIGLWICSCLARWRARQRHALWPVLHEVSDALQQLRHTSSKDIGKLMLSLEDFMNRRTSAQALQELVKDLRRSDEEMQARMRGLAVREEADRTRAAREAQKEEKRRRGQRQQERLAFKAEMLKKSRGGR